MITGNKPFKGFRLEAFGEERTNVYDTTTATRKDQSLRLIANQNIRDMAISRSLLSCNIHPSWKVNEPVPRRKCTYKGN